jgi:hypothetical protein
MKKPVRRKLAQAYLTPEEATQLEKLKKAYTNNGVEPSISDIVRMAINALYLTASPYVKDAK